MQKRRAASVLLGFLLLCCGHLPAQEADSLPHDILFIQTAPNIELEVLDWGGRGPPLVFLAGLQMNAHVFDHLAPRFTDTHHVLGITRRGHGESGWPESGYDLNTRVHDLEAVLDRLDLPPVILAGHSMAGEEMTGFASAHPERVRGLIYIDAAHDHSLLERLEGLDLCPFGPEVMQAMERQFHDRESFRRTQRRDGRPYVSERAVEEIVAAASRPDYRSIRVPALGVYHVPRRIEDLFLGAATPPSECISAFQYYIYDGIGQFAEEMPAGKIVALQDTQHNIHLASPDELEAVMKRWLENSMEGD